MQKLIVVTTQDMQRIEQHLECTPALQAMIEADPEVLALLKIAASEHDARDRWHAYEQLKTLSNAIVGWNARTSALRTSGCYETFIRAIDSLLPTGASDEDQSA